MNKMVKIELNDGVIGDVSQEIIDLCKVLKAQQEDDDPEGVLNILNPMFSNEIITLMFRFLELYCGGGSEMTDFPQPIETSTFTEVTKHDWEKQFLNEVETPSVTEDEQFTWLHKYFKLGELANFVDCKILFEFCSARIAQWIQCHTAEELQKFGVWSGMYIPTPVKTEGDVSTESAAACE